MPHFDEGRGPRPRAGEGPVIPTSSTTSPRPRSRRPWALAEHGDDAKIIAGGQSLLPVLRMRLNAPEVVIDLGRRSTRCAASATTATPSSSAR